MPYMIISLWTKRRRFPFETGALALSCAKNAIIVGDTMQLPNVVTEENKEKLNFIANACLIKPEYDCANMSFLQSICKVIPNIPQTLLREHYRCHPRIINFCNQNFMVEILSS